MRFSYFGVISEIDNLPGCSQVAVSHSAFVPKKQRNRKKGQNAHELRLEEINNLGYNYALCTVCSENVAQLKILAKNRWKKLDEFKSSKTNHLVFIYGRLI